MTLLSSYFYRNFYFIRMKILAFGGSNSKTSINKKLVGYAASLVKNNEVSIIDLIDFEVPTYSINIEKEVGFPENAKKFMAEIEAADALMISFSEHNKGMTAALKSMFDWCSRINIGFMKNKKLFALSTSPGGYGGKNSLEYGMKVTPGFGAEVVTSFSLPRFNDNFKDDKIVEEGLDTELQEKVEQFEASLS